MARVNSLTRRLLLGITVSVAALAASRAGAQSYSGSLPWLPGRNGPPLQVEPGGWTYFTPEEAIAVEALVDRLIPADDLSPGGLHGVSSKVFFQILWQNTKEGFFADPVYGGNRNMAGWKMIGFPGARYDYRDWIDRHNEPYPRPPIGIAAHLDWSTPA